jgi:hAT family C-terminal dimerisation region
LILRENESAYYVHCFAHQLQLTLVAVVKNHKKICLFFQKVNGIRNVVGASCKRLDQLREKHNIETHNKEGVRHCTRWVRTDVTNLHYYRVDLFYTIIDMQLQELNGRLMETTIELLMCMSCLDPNNFFSAFNIDKLLKLAKFYPSNFSEWELSILENQLENYHLDMQSNSDFLEVKKMDELSQKLVEKKKHTIYPLVYKLLTLALILLVTTASVERAFSAMNVVKEASRNKMGDQWLNDCLVTYIERDLFKNVDNERIMQRFQNMKTRRGRLDLSSTS